MAGGKPARTPSSDVGLVAAEGPFHGNQADWISILGGRQDDMEIHDHCSTYSDGGHRPSFAQISPDTDGETSLLSFAVVPSDYRLNVPPFSLIPGYP